MRATFLILLLGLLAGTLAAQKTKKDYEVLDDLIREANAENTIDFGRRYSDEWFEFATDAGEAFEFNPSRATRTFSRVSAWFRVTDTRTGDVLRQTRYEIDCERRELRATDGSVYFDYGRKGRPVKRPRPEYFNNRKGRFIPVAPGSVGDQMAQLGCRLN